MKDGHRARSGRYVRRLCLRSSHRRAATTKLSGESTRTPRVCGAKLALGRPACTQKLSNILIDEKAARLVARERGLRVTGILGVLGEAATRGYVDLASASDRLRKTTFRCSPALLKATLDRFGNP